MKLLWPVAPSTHEVGGHFNFWPGTLAPFREFAEAADREREGSISVDGCEYVVSVEWKGSGLDAAGIDADRLGPAVASDGGVDAVSVALEPRGGLPGESRSFTVSPRWPDQRIAYESDTAGLALHVQGSNEPVDRYPVLVDAVTEWLGIELPEPSPRVLYTAARYVRVDRRHKAELIGRSGIVERLGDAVPGASIDTSGGRSEVMIPTESMDRLFPEDPPPFGIVLKAYTGRTPPKDPAEPLAHPKLEARIAAGEYPEWADADMVTDTLDRFLWNVLAWVGLPVRPDGKTYVADAYFEAAEASCAASIGASPLDDREDHADEVWAEVVRLFRDRGYALEVAQSMFGRDDEHVDTVAEEIGCHQSTVRRVADRQRVFEIVNGRLRWLSRAIRAVVHQLIDRVEAGLDRDLLTSGDGLPLSAVLEAYNAEIQEYENPERGPSIRVEGVERETEEFEQFLDVVREAWVRERDYPITGVKVGARGPDHSLRSVSGSTWHTSSPWRRPRRW